MPPFDLTEREGRLYGRGTADMEGYIACVLALVPDLVASSLRMPVHIALSYDEEVGCLGVRSLPAHDPQSIAVKLQAYAEQQLLPRMRAVSSDSAIHFTELSAYPGLATDSRSQAAELIALFSGSDDFGTVAFGTEGGLFDAAGIATVVCGPGSMDQGHKADEYVSVSQLQGCDQILQTLLKFVRQWRLVGNCVAWPASMVWTGKFFAAMLNKQLSRFGQLRFA